MNTVTEVINQFLLIVDDVRMSEEMRVNPALLYRRLSMYIYPAMSLMKRPPELYKYICCGYTEPTYDDYLWTSDQASTQAQTTVVTGKIGYDLCSVVRRSDDGTSIIPYSSFTYDKQTGNIVFAVQEKVGIEYDINFYSDGSFNDLTPAILRLFALAISVIWYERFSNNWLNMQPKVKDSSFNTVNESNYMEKMTDRMKEYRQSFNDELRKYEQDNAYFKAVKCDSSSCSSLL